MKSNRTHTPPPRIEDLGDGTSYYNFDVVQSRSEEDDYDIFDYEQVRVENPATLEKVQYALDLEDYEHTPELD